MAFDLGDILVTIKSNTDSLKSGVADVQNMGDQSKTMGQKIQTGLNVAAAGLAVVGAGLTAYAKNATDYTENLVKSSASLGRTIGVSTTQASQLVAAFGRMGISADDATQMFGIFSKQIQAATNSSASDALATQKLQIQIDQTKASIAATTAEINKNGDASGALGLKLRDLNNTLSSQQNQLNTSANAFDQLGISVVDTNGKQKDFNTILLEVADKFKAMPDGIDKTTLSMSLFGRSGKDMIKVLDLGSSGIQDLETQADKLGLTLTAKTIGSINNLVQSQKNLKDQTDAMKISVGTATAPVLTSFNKGINDVLSKLMNTSPVLRTVTTDFLAFGGPVFAGASSVLAFAANLDQAIPALIAIVTEIGPFLIVLGLIALAAAAVIKSLGGWKKVMQDLQPEISTTKRLLGDLKDDAIAGFDLVKKHIQDVVDAMMLLITGNFKGGIFGLSEDDPWIKALITAHDTIVNLWNALVNLGNFIGQILSPMLQVLGYAWQIIWPAIASVAAAVWQNLLPALLQLWDAVTRLWNALNPALTYALEVIGAILVGLFIGAIWLTVSVLNILVQAFSFVVSIIANVIDWLSNLIGWFGTMVVAVARAVIAVGSWFLNLPGYAASAIGAVISWFAGLPGRILGALGALGSLLYNAGTQLIQGLINGITDKFKDLAGAVKNVAQGAVNSIKSFLGIHSPSTVFEGIGKNVTQGFVNGINNSSKMATAAMNSLSNGVVGPMLGLNVNGGPQNTSSTSIYGDINIGSQADADYLLARLDRNNQLEAMGLSPAS